jgi:monofunctional biosynthetic peptidoglycan transglycosylase
LLKTLLCFFGYLFFCDFFKFVPVPLRLDGYCILKNKVVGKEVFSVHDWEPIENISMNLQKAVIASEDGRS